MSCKKHVLNLAWEHHRWQRRVCGEKTVTVAESDMWGRQVNTSHVRCELQDICMECGAIKPAGACICDLEEASGCARRLAYLDRSGGAPAG